MRFIFLFFIALILFPLSAYAQNIPGMSGESKEPVEISAGKTLEWHQKDKQYVADGDVEAKQSDVTILADKLIADYRDDDKGGNVQIWQLTAEENVTIKNTDSTAVGDKAVYNVDTGVAVLTGDNLTLSTPDQIITASERMEYDTANGKAKAVGNAKIKRGSDTLTANTLTANFSKDKDGKQTLKSAIASGNVTIKTPDETLTGDNGFYNAGNNTAEVKGNVKIVRGPNVLEGARAEVNLTTNVSKMFGSSAGEKRVKGVFFPGSQKEKPQAEKPAAEPVPSPVTQSSAQEEISEKISKAPATKTITKIKPAEENLQSTKTQTKIIQADPVEAPPPVIISTPSENKTPEE